ncbi:MAG: hypothetical protein AAFN77_18390 [Planctomycetota bacterium]
MLGIVIDTVILIVLIRAIADYEEDSYVQPGLIAVFASLGAYAGAQAAAAASFGVIWILLGIFISIGLLVALGCFALMDIDLKNCFIIGGAFAFIKFGFSILGMFLLSS